MGDIFTPTIPKLILNQQINPTYSFTFVANSIAVKEQTHRLWKTMAAVSAILCALFFLIFWLLTNPFWTGIFRLIAFVFFAGAVLGYLKVMNGPLLVSLDTTDELLLVSYQKKGDVVQEEQFERDTIESVTTTKSANDLLTKLLQPNSAGFQISFTDTDRPLALFEFGGRTLLFDSSGQNKINNYLKDAGIET